MCIYILICIYIKIKKRCIFVACVEYLMFHFWKPQVLCCTVWIYESCGCPESWDLLCWSELAQVAAGSSLLGESACGRDAFCSGFSWAKILKRSAMLIKLHLVVVVVMTFSCSCVICGLSDTAVRQTLSQGWDEALGWKREILRISERGFYNQSPKAFPTLFLSKPDTGNTCACIT